MEFKLQTFVNPSEMEMYSVKSLGEYDYTTGSRKEETREVQAFIYKKTLRETVLVNSEPIEVGSLNGKALKTSKLKRGEIMAVEGLEYRITKVMPRIHANFIEFDLEEVRNDE